MQIQKNMNRCKKPPASPAITQYCSVFKVLSQRDPNCTINNSVPTISGPRPRAHGSTSTFTQMKQSSRQHISQNAKNVPLVSDYVTRDSSFLKKKKLICWIRSRSPILKYNAQGTYSWYYTTRRPEYTWFV
jgi:hypothetical protein